jgi:ADP-heptose:LPS heptosyltransferase
LNALLARWPAAWPVPEFVLLGNHSALGDLPHFDADLLARHCRVEVDRLDLPGVARVMHGCDAFLGADGGLMHLAVACDLPGLAVFVEIDPALRLLPGTRLQSLFTKSAIDDLQPDRIALAWLEALRANRP